MANGGMIERVARAICEEQGQDPDQLEPGDAYGIDGYENDEPCHFVWHHYSDHARAAIAAMREPTQAMIDRVYFQTDASDWSVVWDTMICAALAESE